MLGIDYSRENIGKDFEFVSDANVVAVRRDAERDNSIAHLVLGERLNHALFSRHLADPMIRFQSHACLQNRFSAEIGAACKTAPS
jgi:hypothetical protein